MLDYYKINIYAGFGEGKLIAKNDIETVFRLDYEIGEINVEKIDVFEI